MCCPICAIAQADLYFSLNMAFLTNSTNLNRPSPLIEIRVISLWPFVHFLSIHSFKIYLFLLDVWFQEGHFNQKEYDFFSDVAIFRLETNLHA